jgi:hypothetical protein
MENKPLCISVLTLASLVGFVLLMTIVTWAIRKRQHDKLHDDAAAFKTEDLVGGGHGHDDVEKGSQGMFVVGGGDIINKVEAAAGARRDGGVRRVPTNHSTATTTTETYVGSNYGHGYDPKKIGYGADQGYEVPKGYTNMHGPPMVATQPCYDGREYLNPQNPTPAPYSGPYMSNTYDNALPVASAAYGGVVTPMRAISPNIDLYTAQPVVRKALPPSLTVDVSAASAPIHFAPNSAISFPASPMQPVDPVNAANPPPSASFTDDSSQSTLPRRSSLLNGPVTPKTPTSPVNARRRLSSHSKALDPSIPPVPVAPPLPDKFGNYDLTPELEVAAPLKVFSFLSFFI